MKTIKLLIFASIFFSFTDGFAQELMPKDQLGFCLKIYGYNYNTKKFLDNYLDFFDKKYDEYKNNEFELKSNMDDALQEITSSVNSLKFTNVFMLKKEAKFGEYDFTKNKFEFRPFSNFSDTTRSKIIFDRYNFFKNTDINIADDRTSDIYISNFLDFDGLYFAKDTAANIIKKRSENYYGTVRVNRNVYLKIYYSILNKKNQVSGGWMVTDYGMYCYVYKVEVYNESTYENKIAVLNSIEQPPTNLKAVADSIKLMDKLIFSQLSDDPPPPPPPPGSDLTGVSETIITEVASDNIEAPVLNIVEDMPSFVGGDEAMYKWIKENIKYPQMAKETGITGSTIIGFIVEKDGSITGTTIIKDIGGGCGAEAKRVVNLMPKWTAGKQNGIPVRVQFYLPVRFTEEDSKVIDEPSVTTTINCTSKIQFTGTLTDIYCPGPPCGQYILKIKTTDGKEKSIYITDDFKIDGKKGVYYTSTEFYNLTTSNVGKIYECYDKSVLNKTYTFCCKEDNDVCGYAVPGQAIPKAYFCDEMFSNVTVIEETKTDTKLISEPTGTFTDSRDSKTYKTVLIGTQTWMSENLAYKASSGCWTYNDDNANAKIYGYLYNWKTAKEGCPTGWHLSTDAEWTTLTTYLGGESVAGGKLKEIGTTHWTSPNTGATNESGFTALPGGYRSYDGEFGSIGYYGYWWSSTEYSTINAWSRSMDYNGSNAYRYGEDKANALPVRCVKDN